ncbi:protein O-GlcNAcase isoform X4 [Alligator mississippiensis]|uniref:protein O-GlcNAcase isoform X4 n=1 Tax=Alligator mississippiensis TaxID=8496 RepID=UPI0028774B28|nr:protein O-GlcNAcase isoform X4 [Alligator mississippiensis]
MSARPGPLCGVVEGFYGRPWSMEQRKLLFQWLKRWGLNCYMYAPKDELKHRLLWREPYTEHEAAQLASLIAAAREQGVELVFALSTGQDMVFSSASDRLLLQRKLRQVAAAGCSSFALLFDDIDPALCQADRAVFPSLAQAQASVANEAYRALGQPPVFLFCPTEYCSALCSPSPSRSRYLLALGQELLPGIGIIWTGPKVVSQELSLALLEEVEGVLGRSPVIWDNLYANDYDCRRVFLGPFTGRPPGLMSRLRGLLLNPNGELQANYVPLHTLGTWLRCSRRGHGMHTEEDAAAETQEEPSYSPQEALDQALRDWVAEIRQQVPDPAGSPEEMVSEPEPGPSSESRSHPKPLSAAAGSREPAPAPGLHSKSRVLEGAAEPGDSNTGQDGAAPMGRDEDMAPEAPVPPPAAQVPTTPGLSTPRGTAVANARWSPPVPVADSTDDADPASPRASTANSCRSPPVPVANGASASLDPALPVAHVTDAIQSTAVLVADGVSTKLSPALPLAHGTGAGSEPPWAQAESSPAKGLGLEEVRLLVELFYLPYEHGAQAAQLLQHFRWLQANRRGARAPGRASDADLEEQWQCRAEAFQQLCSRICHLHGRFVSCASRALRYDLHRYLWDLRTVVLAARAFALWMDGRILADPDPQGTWRSCFRWCQSSAAALALAGDAEPWVRHGGLSGELQALLPVGNSCELFHYPPPLVPSSQHYTLRPLLPQDQDELYRLCREGVECGPDAAETLAAHPDLLGDWLLGSFLRLSPKYTFVLEDMAGPCGYAAGTLRAQSFLQQREHIWLPAMRLKYPRAPDSAAAQGAVGEALMSFQAEPLAVPPAVLQRFPSLVQLGTAPRALDPGAARSLAIALLSALRANGSRGVFCEVSAAHHHQLHFYGKLGFVTLPGGRTHGPHTQLLGRLL